MFVPLPVSWAQKYINDIDYHLQYKRGRKCSLSDRLSHSAVYFCYGCQLFQRAKHSPARILTSSWKPLPRVLSTLGAWRFCQMALCSLQKERGDCALFKMANCYPKLYAAFHHSLYPVRAGCSMFSCTQISKKTELCSLVTPTAPARG